jgi:hypothetical protein
MLGFSCPVPRLLKFEDMDNKEVSYSLTLHRHHRSTGMTMPKAIE